MRHHPLVSGIDFLSNSSLVKNSDFVVKGTKNWKYMVMNVFMLGMDIENDDAGKTH